MVEQSPSQSMQNALSPSLKALVAEQLFRHPDDDVKVAVAACISEITRITAPDAPYDDDQMREVFQLIVSSLKNLSDKSSRSFIKRTSILETVATVSSDYHAEAVFTSMVTIMTLVLEESEDIPTELLSPILSSVKKDNEEVLPVARKLAEKVLENCASKLQPYLTQAVENLGISFDDYSSIVASICGATAVTVERDDAAVGKLLDDKSIPADAPLEKAAQGDKKIPKEAVPIEQVALVNEKSPVPVACNGIMQTADSISVKKQEDDHIAYKSENETSTAAEPDLLEAEKVVDPDVKLVQSTREKERKPDSKLIEPSDSSHVDEKEVETIPDRKHDSKDDAGSPCRDVSVDGDVSSENRRETDFQHSSPKAIEDKSTDVASQTPSGAVVDDGHSKRVSRPKKKDSVSKETTSSVDDVSKKAYEGASDSEAKSNRRPGKKGATVFSNKDNAPVSVDKTKKESDTASDSEAKSLKKSSKKQLGDKKRRTQGKVAPEKDGTKNSTKNDDEEVIGSPKSVKPNKQDSHVEGTPKTTSKRKHMPSKEKASDSMEYGENLVGLKVKVWWPKDREFYEGFIHSFDSAKKKHKVHYNDGDEEILNLKREKWAVIEDESGSDEEGAANPPSPDGSSDIGRPQKKKAKTADPSSKKAKMDASPKRGGGTSSGKSKGSATKSGRKTKEDAKVDGKSKDGSKSVSKSGNDSVAKSKDHSTPKTGSKPVDNASKVDKKSKNEESGETPKSTKSKDDGSATPKASSKLKQDISKTANSKQETPKISSQSKGKSLKSGGKSNSNGTGKSKSGSSKVKGSESVKESSTDSAKVVGSVKRKAPSLLKAQGSDSKSGKKRQR
ncbi:Sister chromatid cohesion PDS5 B [Gossypium arboreum]|uniref:Sister chromatid cohesion PDS5 B n=1 Tax=Gossypium arboreum TaxID=29729 RepID=A0A0B0PRG3_GOSAR|nr:Sister chromatid cohesion PDS5 B [Gossypium arboreum]